MANATFLEIKWLAANPDFRMRPATITEFVGKGYLNERNVRPGIMKALIDTFGEDVNPYSIGPKRRAVMTGAIGIGKSTFAAISLCYMVHWVKCLRNPKEFYDLSEDSIIGFMMMSTNEKLAREVIFQKVKRRILASEWFQDWAPIDEKHKKLEKEMRFEGDIWIVPGSSEETSFEGFDILAGIVDEGDSHKVTERRNYAEAGWNTIERRIESRFMDHYTEKHRGLIIAIGQAKTKSGFMMTKYEEFSKDPEAVAVRMSLWESFGWYRYTEDKDDIKRGKETSPRKSFYYDKRKRILLSKEAAQLVMNNNLIEVPNVYRKNFESDPVLALRDLGGIPPEAEDPFIAQTDKVLLAQEKWHARVQVVESPGGNSTELDKVILPKWFRPIAITRGDFKRVIHIDTASSPDGDALGFAMAHCPEKIIQHGEERPVIIFDLLMRIQATRAVEINFGKVRQFIYRLRDDFGFEIDMVTLDGFESIDCIQQLRKNQIKADYLSVDKKKGPYEDLRDVVNDGRIEFPKLMVPYHRGDTQLVNIAFKEITELKDVGKKIDHPPEGSKDVADGMAGCTHLLVSNSKYIRAARSVESDEELKVKYVNAGDLFSSEVTASLESQASFQPISFEEFNNGLPSVAGSKYHTLSRLMNGDGVPGFPEEDRIL